MKNKLLIFVLFLIITACGKEPIADFTWTPQEPKAGEEVRFTNLSTNAKRYSWNLGNMTISNEKNPVAVYDLPGQYIIDLSASSGLRSDMKTVTIKVSQE